MAQQNSALSARIEKFKDRDDALARLVEIMPIAEMRKRKILVIAISFGGVLFAHNLAKILGAEYDLLFTASIPAPVNPECAIAMVSETNDIITHDALIASFGISNDYIYGEAKRRYEEQILSTIYKVRKGEMINSLKNEDIIIVDEGIDSGMTITTAIKSCINRQAKSVSVAVPIMPADVELLLRDVADNIYTVLRPVHFVEVADYYEKYEKIPQEKAEELLGKGFFAQEHDKHNKEKA